MAATRSTAKNSLSALHPRELARSLSASLNQNALLRSRIGSVFHLLTGNFGVAITMLASTAVAARTLGAADFGALALILALGRVCERLVRFESWQPLIRFVAAEENAADPQRLSQLYAYGLLLDVCSAFLAAVMCVVTGWLAASHVGLTPDQGKLVAVYAAAIAINFRGMASAALRMSGKFRTIAYIQFVGGLTRLALALLVYLTGGSLLEFIAAWTFAQALDSLVFNWIGLRTLAQNGIPSPFKASWRKLSDKFPGFLGFAFSTNLSSALRTLTHEADTLLVGFFAGPAAAGLYFLSRRVAKIAQQGGDLIQTVAYPDMARMWTGKGIANLAQTVKWLQIILAVGATVAITLCWFAGEWALHLVFGPDFVDAFPMLLAQLLAVALVLHAAPSRSALLAMNRPTYVLAVAAAATVIFFATALAALPSLGAVGVNLAHIAFGLFTAVSLDVAMWRGLGRVRAEMAEERLEEGKA
ncbi:lipopolysaccharide biosynthesis protein [Croceibacterium sp. LX-88]|uniref:Lipopolysaccharide biosynthesis protein n=1 Tax=Croceibacterium selenioxidans TaxID=2838833 RepID=A0ABS5W3Z9_9SPHN|nr:lipopolysaccharide biosynthesis protein [Croceibacterium selenioxidans]MBT2134047.1 lipopolysaccharide biosynthesis protein [Croceibacterium selenioxidans]